MAVYLTYDGSVNGDWVARYAVRVAAHSPDKRLHVLHVEDVTVVAATLAEKFENIRRIAALDGVETDIEICPMHQGVFGGIVDRVPEGRDTVVVCGVRVRSGRHGFLSGTISEQLLRHGRFETVAFRVVQPGNLGIAHRLLLPVGGDRRGFQAGLALLRLLGPDIDVCRLLHVVVARQSRLRRMDMRKVGELRRRGTAFVDGLEGDLRQALGDQPVRLDLAARVSDDWAREILIDAGSHKTDLIAVEAPVESLKGPFAFGDPLERILRDTPCDVAVYRGVG